MALPLLAQVVLGVAAWLAVTGLDADAAGSLLLAGLGLGLAACTFAIIVMLDHLKLQPALWWWVLPTTALAALDAAFLAWLLMPHHGLP